MNNKGFTLIELLAVIIILLGVAMVSVLSVTSSLERNDKKECERLREIAINAAKVYFSLNGEIRVEVSDLQRNNFIENNIDVSKIKDSNVEINNNSYVFYSDQHDDCYEYLSD